jgi:heme exporter protein A
VSKSLEDAAARASHGQAGGVVNSTEGGERRVQSEGVGVVTVEMAGLTHRFGKRTVFADVNAQVCAGQVLVVTGPNGSGKSTLLRILAGLLPPTEGAVTVRVNGAALDAVTRRQHVGYVAPDLTLYRELTGAENLQFFARLRGLTLSRDDLIAALTEVGLRGRGRDLVSAYSSGMRQRLKYAFALLARPPLLLLDEPTANLDVDGMAMVERVLAAQRARPDGGLTILGTNEPREVEWGDTQIRLETGR